MHFSFQENMNVTQENKDALNAVLKVRIDKADYFEKYETALKEQRRHANIPGFRQGKVPMGIIKKKVGTALLLQEVNEILSKSVQEHIEQNKLQVLGDPLPKRAEDSQDWNEPEHLDFEFELGLAPDFNVKLPSKLKYFTIKVDDKMIDEQIADLTRRYGKLEEVELSNEKDMIFGDLIELNEDGSIKEGGIMSTSTISVEFLQDEATKKLLAGKKKKDEVDVDPRKISKGDDDMAAMLGIDKEVAKELDSTFRFRVEEIKRMVPAELDQTFFDQVFGKDEVKDEAAMREKVAADMARNFSADSDRLFKRDISSTLLDKTKMKLPDDFLKRWLKERNEQDLTPEQIEADYENYAKSLKWQLIENKLIRDNDIQVSPEESMEHVKRNIAGQYAQYGMPTPPDDELEQSARRMLADQEQAKKIYEAMFDAKLLAHYKANVKLNEKEVSFDEFVKMAQQA